MTTHFAVLRTKQGSIDTGLEDSFDTFYYFDDEIKRGSVVDGNMEMRQKFFDDTQS